MFRVTKEYDAENGVFSIVFNGELIEEFQKAFENFFEFYEVENLIFHPDRKPKLISKDKRTCRFCGNSMPTVSFKKIAHLLPQLMGNRNLVTDFECDNCNSLFSRYENDFANFMGLSRTLSFLKGQRGIPKFKTPDKNLIVGNDEQTKDSKRIKIISSGIENDHFSIDQEKKILTINAVRHPYTPIKVFKTLLKIGYSLIPSEELGEYENIKRILLYDEFDIRMNKNPFFRVFGIFSPGAPFPSPTIFCCRKRESKKQENSPSRTFIIYFQNYIYQFFIPYCEADKWMCQPGKIINFHKMPPLLDKKWIEFFGRPGYFNLDLSSYVVRRNEEQTITMSFDAAFQNSSANERTDERQAENRTDN